MIFIKKTGVQVEKINDGRWKSKNWRVKENKIMEIRNKEFHTGTNFKFLQNKIMVLVPGSKIYSGRKKKKEGRWKWRSKEGRDVWRETVTYD